MRSKLSLLSCLLLCAGALSSGQASPVSRAGQQGTRLTPGYAALWTPGLDPQTAPVQAPPIAPIQIPPPKPLRTQMQAPPSEEDDSPFPQRHHVPLKGAQAPPPREAQPLPLPLSAQEPLPLVEAQAPPEPKPAIAVPVAVATASTFQTKPAPPTAHATTDDSSQVTQSNDQYTIWRNGYLQRLYENQLIQSWVIFLLVLLLVGAGLFFSWLQFQHAFLLRQVVQSSAATQTATQTAAQAATPADPTAPAPIAAQAPPPAPAPTQDELTFGKDGVVIRSAYLGVIILVLSMAFFFLYLKYVYLIS